MIIYLIKRLTLIVPTLIGIIIINFIIIQSVPGGPIDQIIIRLKNYDEKHSFNNIVSAGNNFIYEIEKKIEPDFLIELKEFYQFDKKLTIRLWTMIKSYSKFDLGYSYFKEKNVIDLIFEKLPVSVSLGFWSTFLIYIISIPIGIKKAIKNGSRFDTISSYILITTYSIPAFLFSTLLIIFFSGGNYLKIFPFKNITSIGWEHFTWDKKILDYFWHICLPIISMSIPRLSSLILLTKNSFLDELNKKYIITAKSKGLKEKRILYNHIFSNAMLIIISGLPGSFINILFANSLLIEIIFSLDGLGLLGFEATINRDYPVMFGSLYIFTIMNLISNLIRDLIYIKVDPRINFKNQII